MHQVVTTSQGTGYAPDPDYHTLTEKHVTTLDQKITLHLCPNIPWINAESWFVLQGIQKNTSTWEKNIVTPHILIILISYQLLASVVLSTPLPSSFDPPLFLPHLDYFKANPGYLILGWFSFPPLHTAFFLINLLFWKHFRFTQNLQR